MNKPMRGFLIAAAALIISGCAGGQTEDEAPNPSPTTVPTSTPTSTPEPTKPEVSIPMGTAPNINGLLKRGEWDNAAVEEMNDGTLLYLMYADDTLYLAVDSEVMGTVNVGILRDGELWILHSSAALGSAVYQLHENGYQLRKTFDWCCRVSSPLSENEQLLAEEGWLSTNQLVGDQTQTEYLIQIPIDEIILSVTYRYRDDSGAAYWPETLAEEDLLKFTAAPRIGDEPFFSTEMWARLIVSQ
jgi:hypothetical protein